MTSWGGTINHDYSARIWSGLIRDYYVPRLQLYFDTWNPQDFPDKEPVKVDYGIHSELINGLKALEFEGVKGSVRIKEVEIRNRWTGIRTFYPDFTVKAGEKKVLKVGFPPVVTGTAKTVNIKITYSDADQACGVIKYRY